MQAADILILSNGPGEVTTWVRPVVKALRHQLGEDRLRLRISVVLSPCPNATGKEVSIVQSYPEVDRVQQAEHFLSFLLWGKTAENWDWREKGVVVFLGGDQFFALIIAKRLGYRSVVYAEWDSRWHHWIDRFGAMKAEIIEKVPKVYHHKFTVVGDLMADVGDSRRDEELANAVKNHRDSESELIGILPGSKPAKLTQGVPFSLAIAEYIHTARSQTRFVIPVAPTLDSSTLAHYADPNYNPLIKKLGWAQAKLFIDKNNQPFLETPTGLRVELWTTFPAYELLTQCQLCLTTVGANTAELGSLAVPMIVFLPTQQLDAMRSWDGIPGLLTNLPGMGTSFAKLINWLIIRQKRLFAWPNIWANEEIVPELVGNLEPSSMAELVLDLLSNSQKLEQMRSRLREVRGQAGAAQKITHLVEAELLQSSCSLP